MTTIDVLAVMDALCEVADQYRDEGPDGCGWASDELSKLRADGPKARAAVAEAFAERDRLRNIVRSHEAQILRMTAERAELIEAAEKAYGHLACIGHPVDKHGRYHKDGEWTFSEAMPNPADASEAKAAFLTLRAAIARCGGAK